MLRCVCVQCRPKVKEFVEVVPCTYRAVMFSIFLRLTPIWRPDNSVNIPGHLELTLVV